MLKTYLLLTMALFMLLSINSNSLLANDTDNNVLFHIECPSDVTVDCDAEIWDLSPYGWAYVYGYGNPVPAPDPTVTYDLNSCGSGVVIRTWTAYDYSNTPFSCSQYIYVGSNGAFNESNINWPPHYTSTVCGSGLEPGNLPVPYNEPTYDNTDCSMIMMRHEDETFNFGGGCSKILRKWILIDWCNYDPNDHYNQDGRWEYTQVLKIKPNMPITVNCIDDITVSAGDNCSGTYVHLDDVTGIGACGSSVQVVNHSVYANSNGANASGYYPFGTSVISYTLIDGCGNEANCSVKITIRDMKKPTPICYHGITANLMMNHDGYYIDLDPKWFDKGSFDNCTPAYGLNLELVPSRFDCTTVGEQDVRLYVTDSDGNTQYCNTYVIIQDNMGMCPPIDTNSFILSGHILSFDNKGITNLSLDLENEEMSRSSQTKSDGSFEFKNVLNSKDYNLSLGGEGNSDNSLTGISTLDLLKLAKHIHGISPLDKNFEWLAADVDQNGYINVLDLLTLRRRLLNQIPEFTKKYRLIPTSVELNDSVNLSNSDFEEYISLENLQNSRDDLDFTCIKVGDINSSFSTVSQAEDRTNQMVSMEQKKLSENEIGLFSTENMVVEGFQLILNLPYGKRVESVSSTIGLTNTNFVQEENVLTISYYNLDQLVVDKNELLFSVEFSNELQTNDQLELNIESDLQNELYTQNETVRRIELIREVVEEINDGYIRIHPNLVRLGNDISFQSKKIIKGIRIYNNSGQEISNNKKILSNTYVLKTGHLNAFGLFFADIELEDGTRILEKFIVSK